MYRMGHTVDGQAQKPNRGVLGKLGSTSRRLLPSSECWVGRCGIQKPWRDCWVPVELCRRHSRY